MQAAVNGHTVNTGIMHTNEGCRGCNKCLGGCPVFGANIAVNENGLNKIYVDQRRCILCGRCLDLCPHEARSYEDDTDLFLNALSTDTSAPKRISLVVAPSFAINYPQKGRAILGYLKSLGVNHIYSASLGEDIATWGHLQYMAQSPQEGLLSQPCPAVVSYIENCQPVLAAQLVPVQSPMMCTAIYLKKYRQLEDEIAFLGPCVAKKAEIERAQNKGYIAYNVTYERLMQAIGKTDLTGYSCEAGELECGAEALHSAPGSLRENIEYYTGPCREEYINQNEGSYTYLDLHAAQLGRKDPWQARLTDIGNCAKGCNYGSATEFRRSFSSHIPYAIHQARLDKGDGASTVPYEERRARLNQRFAGLRFQDFLTGYENRGLPEQTVGKAHIQHIFREMLKVTEAEQTMDCSACGYQSCKQMAAAIALDYNYKENCIQYIKKKLLIEQSEARLQRQKYELLQTAHMANIQTDIDQLTGFVNRYGFEKRLEKALHSAKSQGQTGTVIMVDLDDFKAINEGYGPDFGNSLLLAFSAYLKDTFGETAELFRLGGDEFVLLMENSSEAGARTIADKLLRRLQRSWEIFGIRLYCTGSIGLTRFPYADDSIGDIVEHAEIAMYSAKQQGKNNCVVYGPETQSHALEQVDTIRQMRDAVANGFQGFELVYQPWVTTGGRIIGAESLLRWKNEKGEGILPTSFIPLAENTGLISPMGEFVLQTAAGAAGRLTSLLPDFMVSVNVSAKQFQKPDLYERFLHILNSTGVNMHSIVLEITESLGIEDMDTRRAIFDRFVQQGLRIALDDFGTGYSSLSYLNELPLDLVKIDRNFVVNIDTDSYSKNLIALITDLMHKMGRLVCVEGVETAAQLHYCKSCGVDIIQGYYFYKPMPLDELEALIRLQQ